MNTISIAPRLALIAGAAVLLGIPAAATGQAIEVRPGMSVGDTWRYSASLDVLISQETEHEAEMGRVVQTAHMELQAVREGADGGLVVRGRFDRLTAVWRRNDTQLEFSWIRPAEAEAEEQQVNPGAEDEGELTPEQAFQLAYEHLAERPFEIILSGAGEVRSVAGLAGAAQFLQRAPGLDVSALGMFLPPRFAEQVQPIWHADGAAAVTAAGDEWTRTRRVALGPAGAFDFETRWKAERFRNGELTCEAAIEVQVIEPQEATTAQPSIQILRGAGEAELEWSTTESRLLTRQEKVDLATRWTLGDIEIAIAQLSTRRLNRLDK